MNASILLLPGDGIGPEVITQAHRALVAVAGAHGHTFSFETALIGGCAIDATGSPLPHETLTACARADAVLLGAVGGPKWDDPSAAVRPEQGLLALRRAMGVFANLRPVRVRPAGAAASPLRRELVDGVDLLFVRELTGGIYSGEKSRALAPGGERATDLCAYETTEIERVVRVAAQLARARRKTLTSVDKANVLETSRLWRAVTDRLLQAEFPDVTLEHMLVDTCAMQLLRRPAAFDVIVTENMFGDILTDEASMLAGSMGLLPSASLSGNDPHRCQPGLFEPIHGSAPDIAGCGVANPVGAILSAAMLLKFSLGLDREAAMIEAATDAILSRGLLPRDLSGATPGVSTSAFGSAVISQILSAAVHE